jgi:hypothetical protein
MYACIQNDKQKPNVDVAVQWRHLKHTFPFLNNSSACEELNGKGETLGWERSSAGTAANHPFDEDGTWGVSFDEDVSVEPRITFPVALSRFRDFVLKGKDPREGDNEMVMDIVKERLGWKTE